MSQQAIQNNWLIPSVATLVLAFCTWGLGYQVNQGSFGRIALFYGLAFRYIFFYWLGPKRQRNTGFGL